MSIITLKLKKIDAVKWGVITGAVYALLSLIIIIPMFLLISVAGGLSSGFGETGGALGLFGSGIAMLFAPILYGIIGFIFGVLGALILNFVLSKSNGLDIDFEKTGIEISELGKEPV